MVNLNTLLQLANPGHTDLQMDRFITAKSGGTAYGCLFQCLREIRARVEGLHSQCCQMISLSRKLEQKDFPEAITQLETQHAFNQLKTQSYHTIRELFRFYSQAISLYAYLQLDKDSSEDRLNKLEEERWEYRILADAALSIASTGTVSAGVLSLIQCLPVALRKKVMTACFGSNPSDVTHRNITMSALVDWYMNYEFEMPEPASLAAIDKLEVLQCCLSQGLFQMLPSSFLMGVGLSLENNTQNAYQSVKCVKDALASDVVSAVAF